MLSASFTEQRVENMCTAVVLSLRLQNTNDNNNHDDDNDDKKNVPLGRKAQLSYKV